MYSPTSMTTTALGSALAAGIAVSLALIPAHAQPAVDPNRSTAGVLTGSQSVTAARPGRPAAARPLRRVLGPGLLATPYPRLPVDDAVAAAQVETTARQLTLSVGTGQLVRLPRPITGMFIANDTIADVQVKSPTQVYLFAKTAGETSIYCTDRSGAVVWSAAVRVGNNIAGVPGMLKAAMPDAAITATPVSGMLLLTGTVAAPKDIEEAQRLTELFTGGTVVLNRLRTATPMQVMLQVKIAEVSRSVARDIGVNLLNRDAGPTIVGIAQGTPGSFTFNNGTTSDANGVPPGGTGVAFQQLAGTTLGIAGRIFHTDLLATLQLYENNGLVTTLAEPNLVALSGETASFLAGGEIPVPQSQGLGAVSVDFKQYGVSLSFTPTVMSDGRISMRVRPEVSQLSDEGSVKLNGFTIPGLSTRRAETTVELGSGQSFVIGGLLQNSHNNTVAKAPFLGDLPIIGALFRSNSFRKSESELMIVVTPYLVKPVDANKVALPTDGYRAAPVVNRIFGNQGYDGRSGETRPVPTGQAAPQPALPAPPAPAVAPRR